MYCIMIKGGYYLGYLVCQNMIHMSENNMILLYESLTIKLLHAHDIIIPLDEEFIKQDKFNIVNENLLKN